MRNSRHLKVNRQRNYRRVQGRGELLEPRCVLAGEPLLISEFMAANQSLTDRYSEYSDWIEIYNPTDQDLSLEGWALTDDPTLPQQWVFPDVSITAHGTQVVFATERDRRVANSELHTNFKLGIDGDYLALVRPDGTIAHEYAPEYPQQFGGISYGVAFDAQGPQRGTQQYFETPSPGVANTAGAQQFADNVSFDVARGFFDQPFVVHIATDTLNGLIRYTTDGSEPTREHGELYTGGVTISTTTTLRAVSYRADMLSGEVGTQSYIFLDDVLKQTGEGMGLPTQWGYFDDQGPARPARGQANYAMDPDIVNNPAYAATLKDDLLALPTLSLVLDPNDLWDLDTGIYLNPEAKGDIWERPASMELIQPDGETVFQIDAGVQIHGGWARRISQTGKFSFRVAFKDEYGAATLDYPLFGDEGAANYNEIVLRGGFNDSWANSDRNNTYMQDQWTRQAQRDMGGLAPRQTYVHLYLNGLYWGLYSPTERPNALWAANYQGGNAEDYDVINTGGNVVDGTSNAWNDLSRALAPARFNYESIKELVDLEAFADYMIVNQYVGNWDWPHNNWYASRHRVDGGKWYFHSWDAEAGFQNLTEDRISGTIDAAVGPSNLYLALRDVPEFQEIMANHISDRMFNGGELTPEANTARLNALATQIDEAIVGESARWGDGRTNANAPVTQAQWAARITNLNETYFPRRATTVLGQYRRVQLFPTLDPPDMTPAGGRYSQSTDVTLASPGGDIYYTRDGSDPRGLDGLPAPNAVRFNSYDLVNRSTPASYIIPTNGINDAQWMRPEFDDAAWTDGLAALGYDNGVADDPLSVVGGFRVLTVVSKTSLANLADVDALLAGTNQGTIVDQSGVRVINYHQTGRDAHFDNSDPFPVTGNNFAQEITGRIHVNQPGKYTFGVTSNDAARLSIDGQLLYADVDRHNASDTLVTLDLTAGDHDVNLTFFQRLGVATLEFYVAPGAKTEFDDSFVLVGDDQDRPYQNRISTDLKVAMYEKHSSFYSRIPFHVADPGLIDQLELRMKYDDGFVMYLNGTEVARRNAPDSLAFNATAVAGRRDSLAVADEFVDLTAVRDQLRTGENILAIHSLNASASDNDLLLLPQLVAFVTPPPLQVSQSEVITARRVIAGDWSATAAGEFIVAQPATGDTLRISEVHYHPADATDAETAAGFSSADDFEFIELVNISSQTLDLSDVALTQVVKNGDTEGVAFEFAGSRFDTLAPGARIVVVENLSAFAMRYGLKVPVAGQWTGGLSNATETLTLSVGTQPILQFAYADKWFSDTDGGGASLEVVNPQASDLTTWSAAAAWQASVIPGGTPGYAGGSFPGDANHDGIFDTDDLLLVMQAAEFEDGVDSNSTWEEGDWNYDGEFNSRDLVLAFTISIYQPTAPLGARSASSPHQKLARAFDAVDALDEHAWADVGQATEATLDLSDLATLVAANRAKSRGPMIA